MDNRTNPYSAPQSNPNIDSTYTPNGLQSVYGPFRDATKLSKTLIALLAADGALVLLYGLLQGVYYYSLNLADLNFATNIEPLIMVVGISMLVTYLVTFIVFAVWTNRMMKNTWAIQGPYSLMKPGWAVGWYFIPIASLWKPLEAVQQMRNVAFNGSTGLNLTPWWTTWIASTIVGRISTKMPMDTLEDLQTSAFFDAVTSPIDIANCIFALILVKKLTTKQKETAEQ